jgi:hypothetical protein
MTETMTREISTAQDRRYTVSVNVVGTMETAVVTLDSSTITGDYVVFYNVAKGQHHLQVQSGGITRDSFPDIESDRYITVTIST